MLTMKNNIRFALYARLSREDESDNDESRSIENQHKNIKEYLTSKEFILVNEYIDDGVSGASLNRPGFNELLNDFEQGLFDGIIVKDLSRLGRKLIEVMVNQILTHIGNTNFELIDYCKKHDIVVEAYSPIAHGVLLNNKVVKEMALKYNVSIAKLCIRYTLQLGFISLPKTANYEHMKENGDVDFVISDSDMKLLCEINKIDSYGDASAFPCYAKQM